MKSYIIVIKSAKIEEFNFGKLTAYLIGNKRQKFNCKKKSTKHWYIQLIIILVDFSSAWKILLSFGMTERLLALLPKNSFEQRGRLYKGRDPRSKTKHIYARAVPFSRHGSRKRHFTRPKDSAATTRRGKRALMLVIQSRYSSLSSRVYIGSRSEILRGMHATRRSNYYAIPEATSSPRNPT